MLFDTGENRELTRRESAPCVFGLLAMLFLIAFGGYVVYVQWLFKLFLQGHIDFLVYYHAHEAIPLVANVLSIIYTVCMLGATCRVVVGSEADDNPPAD